MGVLPAESSVYELDGDGPSDCSTADLVDLFRPSVAVMEVHRLVPPDGMLVIATHGQPA
jgi:hypothetical protein